MKVHRTFTGHPLFCKKCRIQGNLRYSLAAVNAYEKSAHFPAILLQSAEFVTVHQKLFLTGIEASGLTDILPSVEQKGRGERS